MELRHFKYCVLIFLWCISSPRIEGAIHQTLTHCCDLGKNYANTDVACANIQPPFDGVDKKDERNCMSTLVICCKTQAKENECRLGINDAASGTCNSASGSERKECCEACNFGKESAGTGSCDNSFSLGAPYDRHFKSCCEKLLPKTSTMPTTLPRNSKDEQPPLGNWCEIEDLCAQICIPTGDSYKCDCNPGFALMADGNSCKEVKSKQTGAKSNNRCDAHNPCAHNCVDTGVAIICTCNEGYELGKDKRSCIDIDECAQGQHECLANETCVNGDGYYDCISEDEDDPDYELDCPKGFRYSWENKKCEDIDECVLPLTCLPGQTCKNNEGSYECTGGELVCPSGYFFKASTQDCADIDECITGKDDCNRESQVCLNTKGSYTCVDKASKKSCPAGFMMNPIYQICVDIDECAQDIQLCAADELCVNEEGGHTCMPRGSDPKPVLTNIPTTKPSTTTTVRTTPKSKATTISTTLKTTTKTTTSKPKTTTAKTTTTATTRATPTTTTSKSTPKTTTTTARAVTTTLRATPQFIPQTAPTRKPAFYPPPGFRPSAPVTCNRGYRYSERSKQCEDIDECAEGPHNCDNYQQCYNTLGSYICNCKIGFTRDAMTGACTDINECQVGSSDCSDGQRCDNTVGSYLCSRMAGCGTGYTLNYETGLCEDDDECALRTHSCDRVGKGLICRNTQGSYRCDRAYVVHYTPPVSPNVNVNVRPLPVRPYRPPLRPIYPNYTIVSSQSKKCLPGYYMDAAGACQDVDECQSNPCPLSHKCINLNGRYECIPSLICSAGYELNSSGETCVDVNECSRGVHTCDSTEICKNYVGFFRCECPPGHKKENGRCVDIDECMFFRGRVCSYASECVNTIGSYHCDCKEGFEKVGDKCVDVDECKEAGRCDFNCLNTWGSYKCYCKTGYILNSDNRTCSDVDECKMFSHQVDCVGDCVNTPGSYECKCPLGYRLGSDGHTCQDIDECKTGILNPCKDPDTICYNTRGSYECPSIACPPNFVRDKNHKSRCKYDTKSCRFYGSCDNHEADQISYHFFNIVSNFAIQEEPIKFFKMNGPQSPHSGVAFKLDVKNINYPYNVPPAGIDFFRLDQEQNSATISILKSIQGPQQIELTLQLQIFNRNILDSTIMSKIIMFISQYGF